MDIWRCKIYNPTSLLSLTNRAEIILYLLQLGADPISAYNLAIQESNLPILRHLILNYSCDLMVQECRVFHLFRGDPLQYRILSDPKVLTFLYNRNEKTKRAVDRLCSLLIPEWNYLNFTSELQLQCVLKILKSKFETS